MRKIVNFIDSLKDEDQLESIALAIGFEEKENCWHYLDNEIVIWE